jgi:hypothetical protein
VTSPADEWTISCGNRNDETYGWWWTLKRGSAQVVSRVYPTLTECYASARKHGFPARDDVAFLANAWPKSK